MFVYMSHYLFWRFCSSTVFGSAVLRLLLNQFVHTLVIEQFRHRVFCSIFFKTGEVVRWLVFLAEFFAAFNHHFMQFALESGQVFLYAFCFCRIKNTIIIRIILLTP